VAGCKLLPRRVTSVGTEMCEDSSVLRVDVYAAEEIEGMDLEFALLVSDAEGEKETAEAAAEAERPTRVLRVEDEVLIEVGRAALDEGSVELAPTTTHVAS